MGQVSAGMLANTRPGTYSLGRNLSWLAPLALAMVLVVAVTTLGRIAILLWQGPRVAAAGIENLPFILGQGLRFDVLTLGLFFGIPLSLTPLLLVVRPLVGIWARLLCIWSVTVILIVAFMEIATPSFINEFDIKPDRRFIEYLIYPREVAATLWGAYKMPLLVAAVALYFTIRGSWRLLWPRFRLIQPVQWWAALLILPICLFVTLAAIRSTTDRRPVNPSTVVFSRDPLANQLSLNSSYTALYALYELQKEERKFAYRGVAPEEAIAAAQADARLPAGTDFEPGSTRHEQIATRVREHPLNLVIILEESLGAEFVGSLGGLPLTPELDRLQHQGIWFEQLYATGVRSARGLEAVMTGFPPTTAQSVVKLPRAQRDFFTLASLLEAQGYQTSFLYGGEPQFDNMGRFFANNGVEYIIGRHDFGDDVFTGAWGVADEDLFRRAHEYFSAQAGDQPFVSLVFTSSNHSPWEYPGGRIELYAEPAATRENAVRYADYALGEFMRMARASSYWDNTIFLVIADHCSRVYGADLVPIERFHIPGLILGADIEPQRIGRIASQIDMVPTVLSLMGINSVHPSIGIDHTRADLGDFSGRAIMQYGSNQAYLQGDQAIILQPRQPPRQFLYRDQQLVEVATQPGLAGHAEALANWPFMAYRDGWYQAQGAAPKRTAALR